MSFSRSKKETERLHRMHKPVRPAVTDDLPSIHSDDEEDEEEWSSGIEDSEPDDLSENSLDELSDGASSSASSHQLRRKKTKRARSDDEEMPYEAQPRNPRTAWTPDSDNENAVKRLPIKLADGRVQESSNDKVLLPREAHPSDGEDSEEESPPPVHQSRVEDVSTGARFGRPAVIDVVGNKSRKARVQAAKEQIAGICQEIVADPENSVCL